MQKKKIFVLLGHPDSATFTGALADRYEADALQAGHEVRRQNLGEMRFDPILHKGYKEIQSLEPDVKTFQENVKWADHLVILYPNWWCSMPALLKGLFDRAWLPGFAFRFDKTKSYSWQKLLKGKSARIIICAAADPHLIRMMFGEFTNELARATLGFSGITTAITIFAPVEKATNALRERWLTRVGRFGTKGI